MKTLKMVNMFGLCLALTINLASCRGQSQQLEQCKTAYKEARMALNTYYKTQEQSLLQKSMNNINSALACEGTRQTAIDLKITLLVLLKKYREGYAFVDSLNEKDFKERYKKKMSRDFFLALEYETGGDTINRNKVFNGVISDIQHYIQNENMAKDTIDKVAYYDLFTVKSMVMNVNQVAHEIELLKKQHPNNEAFFDELKESFSTEPKIVMPVPGKAQ